VFEFYELFIFLHVWEMLADAKRFGGKIQINYKKEKNKHP
jgi:hypothetical protein